MRIIKEIVAKAGKNNKMSLAINAEERGIKSPIANILRKSRNARSRPMLKARKLTKMAALTPRKKSLKRLMLHLVLLSKKLMRMETLVSFWLHLQNHMP